MLVSFSDNDPIGISPFVFEEDYLAEGVDDLLKSTLHPITNAPKFSPIAIRKEIFYQSAKQYNKNIVCRESLDVSFVDDRQNIVSKHLIYVEKKRLQQSIAHAQIMAAMGAESAYLHSKIAQGLTSFIKNEEDYDMYYLHGALLFTKQDIAKNDIKIDPYTHLPNKIAAICVNPIDKKDKSAHEIMKLHIKQADYIKNAWKFYLHITAAQKRDDGHYGIFNTPYVLKAPEPFPHGDTYD